LAVLVPAVSLFLLALASSLPASGPMSEAVRHRTILSPLDLTRIDTFAGLTPATVPSSLGVPVVGESIYVPLQIEFVDAASRKAFRPPEGITVYHELDRFANAFLDVRARHSLDDLQAMAGIVWIDADMQTIHVPPPPPPPPAT
jgi:hypothetical protein